MASPKACTNKSGSCIGVNTPTQPEDVFSGFLVLFVSRSKLAGYKKNKSNRGFTMLEVIIVMGLLVIVGSLGLFMSMETFRGNSFRNDRDATVSGLQRARSLAVSNMCFGFSPSNQSQCALPDYCCDGKSHGVHFYNKADIAKRGKFVIFQGDNFSEGAFANEFVSFNNPQVYVDIDSDVNISFARISGNLIPETATSTSVTITDGNSHNSVIEINSEGRIDWTN